MKALGMIEVYGRIGAIEGLDSAVKTANVSLVNMIRVGGGLTSVFVEGDVGAVKAAIDAGAAAAERVGKLLSAHVIPRPDSSVRKMLQMNFPKLSDDNQSKGGEIESYAKDDEKLKEEVKIEAKEEIQVAPVTNVTSEVKRTKKIKTSKQSTLKDIAFEDMTVGELRKAAREMDDFPLTKQEIKFAKKDDLLKAMKK